MWRVVVAVLLTMRAFVAPVAAEHGPDFGDVECPTGSARIVLDPGHGGPDPGAVYDTYGLLEKALNLEVAERTAEILRNEHGYSVALTRQDNETELGNSERGAIANACGASVFVEIHLNAALDRSVDYSQTFWAEKEKDLAFSLVMNTALGDLAIPRNAVDRFDNGGLLRAKMPSVLVEAVFVSNTEEAKDLANGTRQEGIARAIASGVASWMHLQKQARRSLNGRLPHCDQHRSRPMTIVPVRNPLILAVGMFMLGSVFGPFVASDTTSEGNRDIEYPPGEPIHGATLGEWSARHWQWTVSFPVGINPGHDVSGTTCGYGQSGPVFFVPRNFPPCVIPSGVGLFVPIAGTECSTAERPPFYGQNEGALRSCAADEVDRYTAIVVRVDGEKVPNIESHRATSPLFTMFLPENNVLGAPPGVGYAVADGYQVMLRPLPVGDHEIVVHVELTDGTILPDKVLRVTVVEPIGLAPGASPVPGTPATSPVS